MTAVAEYYAKLGISINQRQFKQADAALDKIYASMLKLKSEFSKSIAINPKIQFNSLQFQRSIQKSLDQVSKLTTFNLDRFNVDASRLTSSLESAIRRAQYSAGSIRVRAIAERSPLSQSARAIARQQHEGASMVGGGTGGVAGLVAASRAGFAGIAGYTGVQAFNQTNDYINGVQSRVIGADTSRLLLDQAIGGSERRKAQGRQWYKDTTNYLGLDAAGGIGDFNTALTLQTGQGISTNQALKNYDSFLQRFTLRHLTSDQQKGSLRQITQILGRGTVQAEDLNSLVENGDPEIKNLIREAWARRTNYKGGNVSKDYAAAQKKGTVTSEDLLGAYAISARRNAAAIEEASQSLRADAQRTANSRFWADMERNSAELTKTLEERNKAEQELYTAAVPLQQLFTKMVEIPVIERLTEFTESLTGFAKWYEGFQKLTGDEKSKAATDAGEEVAWWTAKRLAKNNLIGTAVDNNWLGFGDGAEWLQRFLLGPEPGEAGNRFTPDFLSTYKPLKFGYKTPVNEFQMPTALPWTRPVEFGSNPVVDTPASEVMSQIMNQTYSTADNRTYDNRVVIEPGAININGANMDVNQIGDELESRMNSIARQVQSNTWADGMINYPATGR